MGCCELDCGEASERGGPLDASSPIHDFSSRSDQPSQGGKTLRHRKQIGGREYTVSM